jgi:adenosine deaminase
MIEQTRIIIEHYRGTYEYRKLLPKQICEFSKNGVELRILEKQLKREGDINE